MPEKIIGSIETMSLRRKKCRQATGWAALLMIIIIISGCHTVKSGSGDRVYRSQDGPSQNESQQSGVDSVQSPEQKTLSDASPRQLNSLIPDKRHWKSRQANSDEIPIVQRSKVSGKAPRVLEPAIHWGRMVHIVQPGETLTSISTKYYGTGSYWQIIFNENHSRLTSPSAIPVGERLYLPVNPGKGGGGIVLVPLSRPDFFIVGAGDTLYKIADLFLGDGNQWQKIYEANRYQLSSPEDIQEGLSLVIP